MTRELELISRIRRRLPSAARPGDALRVGIGDDAAIFRPSTAMEWVLSCDAFLENQHFLAAVHPAATVGYKALARATSDLAAIGATPRYFLLGLALPGNRTTAWLDAFLRGMARAARRFHMILAGGDTSRHSTIAIQVTVLGEIEPGRSILRSGARPGDALFVSGRLGCAQLGLELILRGMHHRTSLRPLLRPHLAPPIRIALGQWLARRQLASAMIDTSDGLSTDLGHLCRASHAGARVFATRIPAVRVPDSLARRGFDAATLALHGGEDYELLFTVPRRLASRIPRSFAGARLTRIGEITSSRKIVLVNSDETESPLVPRGWDPFRAR